MITFADFMQEIQSEAEAEGPEAMAELREFHDWYRKTRKAIQASKLAVREHPLVAEYLVTVEAPSQATSDAEIQRVANVIRAGLIASGIRGAAAEAEALSLILKALPEGYRSRIDPLALGPKCAACNRPVFEQVALAAKSNTECIEAMLRVEKHRAELADRVIVLQHENERLREKIAGNP